MVMDSLRYWVEEVHVDGFRFDLATSLGREREAFDPHAVFFDAIRQDPVLSQVKLIAEPWDIGPDGYQLGNFPPGFAEWNGSYRDGVRSFWRGDEKTVPDLARSLLGSAELFDHGGRRPWASVNFVTAHDGFTLIDLLSYNDKHNEANREDNKDGHDDNRSWNCGVEGATDDPAILDLRDRHAAQRDGDAVALAGHAHDPDGRRVRPQPARQQQRLLPGQRDLLDVVGGPFRTQYCVRGVRAGARPLAESAFTASRYLFLHGDAVEGTGVPDVVWIRPDAKDMEPDDWENGHTRSIGLLFCATDRTRLLILVNAHHETVPFRLPNAETAASWRIAVDTDQGRIDPEEPHIPADTVFDLPARSLFLFVAHAQ